MTYWAFSALFNAIASGLLGVIVFIRNTSSQLHISYARFCLTLFLWSISYFIWQISNSEGMALLWLKILMAFAVFIPICYLHYVYIFLGEFKKYRLRIFLSYIFGGLSAYLCFTKYFVIGVEHKLVFKYWPTSGVLFLPFLIIWFCFIFLSIFSLIRKLSQVKTEMQRNQIKYLLMATFIGSLGGATNYPLWFNIPILPIGNILTSAYAGIIAFTILKYRLMDIRLVVTNVGIFFVIYTLVLGLPFYFYAVGLRFIALIGMFGLATAGPIIFNLLRRQAENKIFEEQKRYQDALLQASKGLGSLKTQDKIIDFISNLFFKAMSLDNLVIYSREKDQYVLQNLIGKDTGYEKEIPSNHYLIACLRSEGTFLVHELENKIRNDAPAIGLTFKYLTKLKAGLVVPVIKDKKLLGIIVLGNKIHQNIFSDRDIVVLNIVADHMALALENAAYLKAETERMQEEGAGVRRMLLDTMVSTMAHEIDNPLNVIKYEMRFLKDMIEEGDLDYEKLKAFFAKHIPVVDKTADRISHIIHNIENFSKGQIKIQPIKIENLLEDFEVLKKLFLKKYKDVVYREGIDPGLPAVVGDATMLQEIMANFFENSLHATKNNETTKEVTLRIYKANGNSVRIEYKDNGYGMDEATKKKIFETTYTTKPHGEGTGLGCWRVRKICDYISGKYGFDSEGRGKGASFWVDLQVAD